MQLFFGAFFMFMLVWKNNLNYITMLLESKLWIAKLAVVPLLHNFRETLDYSESHFSGSQKYS